ncbi:hypothetical protein P9112_008047 [Eukaryota sp. TZLM1-RC]
MLDHLVSRLSHDIPSIRLRALTNIDSKVKHGIISLRDLITEDLILSLLNWFNYPDVPNPELALSLLSQCCTLKHGADLIRELDGITFFQDMSIDPDIPSSLIEQIKALLHTLTRSMITSTKLSSSKSRSTSLTFDDYSPTKPSRPLPFPPNISVMEKEDEKKSVVEAVTIERNMTEQIFEEISSEFAESLTFSGVDDVTFDQELIIFRSIFGKIQSIFSHELGQVKALKLIAIFISKLKTFKNFYNSDPADISDFYSKFSLIPHLLPLFFSICFVNVTDVSIFSNIDDLYGDVLGSYLFSPGFLYNCGIFGPVIVNSICQMNDKVNSNLDYALKVVKSVKIYNNIDLYSTLIDLYNALPAVEYLDDVALILTRLEKFIHELTFEEFDLFQSILISLINSSSVKVRMEVSSFISQLFSMSESIPPSLVPIIISPTVIINLTLDTEGQRVLTSFYLFLMRNRQYKLEGLTQIVPFLVSLSTNTLFHDVATKFLNYVKEDFPDVELVSLLSGLFLISSCHRTRAAHDLMSSKYSSLFEMYSQNLYCNEELNLLKTDPLINSANPKDYKDISLVNFLPSRSKTSLTSGEIKNLCDVILEYTLSSSVRSSALNSLATAVCGSRDFSKLLTSSFLSKLIDFLDEPRPGFVLPILVFLVKALLGEGHNLTSDVVKNTKSIKILATLIVHPSRSFRYLTLSILGISLLTPSMPINTQSIHQSIKFLTYPFVASNFKVFDLIFEPFETETGLISRALPLVDFFINNGLYNYNGLFKSNFFDLNCSILSLFSPVTLMETLINHVYNSVFNPSSSADLHNVSITIELFHSFFDFLNSEVHNNGLALILARNLLSENMVLYLIEILKLNWNIPDFQRFLIKFTCFLEFIFDSSFNYNKSHTQFLIPSNFTVSVFDTSANVIIHSIDYHSQSSMLESNLTLLNSFLKFFIKFSANSTSISRSLTDELIEKLTVINLNFVDFELITTQLLSNLIDFLHRPSQILNSKAQSVEKSTQPPIKLSSEFHVSMSNDDCISILCLFNTSYLLEKSLENLNNFGELLFVFLSGIKNGRLYDLLQLKSLDFIGNHRILTLCPRFIDCLSLIINQNQSFLIDDYEKIVDFCLEVSSFFVFQTKIT